MKTSIRTLMIAAVCLSVTACESIDTFSSAPKGETTVSSQGSARGDIGIGMEYADVSREMSNGSVEIYGLEEPISPGGGRAYDGGVPASDPNVTVYPIGDMPSYGTEVQPAPAPRLMPPSEHSGRMDSPFGGALQEPAVIDSTYEAQQQAPVMPAFTPLASTVEPQAPQRPAPATERSRIYFGHGSSRINSAGQDVVSHVAKTASGAISVEGHASSSAEVADPVERRIVNLKMSMDRAFEVSKNLIRKGVSSDKIVTKAYGDAQPSAPVAGVSQEAADRRVEILQEGQQNALAPAPRRGPVATPVYPPAAPPEPEKPNAPIPPLSRY